MSAGFARYLPQFTVDRPGDLLAGNEILFSPKSTESTLDVLVEAEERGRREGAATAKAEAEQARGEAEIAFERRIGQERRRWTESQADVLAARIAEGLAQLETRIATIAARILVPFLEAKLRDKALVELTGTLRELLADSRMSGLTISGPEDLLAMIRSRLGTSAAALSYVIDEATDIHITGDDIAIETQLRVWSNRIGRAVAES
jgi:hypothetical protein